MDPIWWVVGGAVVGLLLLAVACSIFGGCDEDFGQDD